MFLLPCRVSNDFLKSTKTMQSGDLISSDCSNMIRSVLIWSAHTLFCLNSAWFSRSLESTAAPSRCRIITDRCIIPLQSTQILSFPFWKLYKMPFLKGFFQYDGTSSFSQILPKEPYKIIATFSVPALRACSRNVVWPWTLAGFSFSSLENDIAI